LSSKLYPRPYLVEVVIILEVVFRIITRNFVKHGRIFENTYLVVKGHEFVPSVGSCLWRTLSSFGISTYKAEAVKLFLFGRRNVNLKKTYNFEAQEDIEFLKFLELIPSSKYRVWFKVKSMLLDGETKQSVLNLLSAHAISDSLLK